MIVIGLDGAAPDVLFSKRLDELPTLARIVRDGAHGPLESTSPPITVPAWTVMTSSLSPARLGVFGFRNRRRGAYADGFLATGAHVRAKRAWDYLGDAGYRVIVHGVPQTFPAYAVNGVMTACFLAPGADHPAFCSPADARVALGPDYPVDVEGYRDGDAARIARDARRLCEAHFDAAERLAASREWDFLMMVEMGVDRVQHALWRYHDPEHVAYAGDDHPLREAVFDHYRLVDERVGRLVDRAPRDALVLVVSDHGMQRLDGAVNVNEWLRREGYLVLRHPPQGPMPFREADVDWSRTRAWAYGGYHARVFVNLAGREPSGTVRPADLDGFLDELADGLRSIRGPGGAPIAGTVVRAPVDEVAGRDGLDLACAPDLHAYFGALRWRSSQGIGQADVWSRGTEVGVDGANHAWNGVFALHDPLAPLGRRLDGLRIVDVCPTILRAFGVDSRGSHHRPIGGRDCVGDGGHGWATSVRFRASIIGL